MASQGSIDDLRDLGREATRLRKALDRQETRQLNSAALKGELREFVQTYFRIVRPKLLRLELDLFATDGIAQRILELADRRGAIAQYKKCVIDIKAALGSLEMETERRLSDFASQSAASLSPIEAQILQTLRQLLPGTAASYEQVVIDLSGERLSFRGTATELREILRETLDKLAPNEDVQKQPSFQFEKGRERPTMSQKVRFILRQRGLASNSIEVPRKAIEIVEGTVSSFVRSTYDRGSIDTHTPTGIGKAQVQQLKMYVDTVLCELLEIHARAK